MRIFAGTAFQGEKEHASRHLVGWGPCSGLAAEVVVELAARQALAPGKSSRRAKLRAAGVALPPPLSV